MHSTLLRYHRIVLLFLKIFVLLWGHWYPCFGFLVMSPLGFKVRVGSLIHTWWRHICDVHSLRFTSGATPADLLTASMAASRYSPHACFSRGRMPDRIVLIDFCKQKIEFPSISWNNITTFILVFKFFFFKKSSPLRRENVNRFQLKVKNFIYRTAHYFSVETFCNCLQLFATVCADKFQTSIDFGASSLIARLQRNILGYVQCQINFFWQAL